MPHPRDIIAGKQRPPRKQRRPRAAPTAGQTPQQFRTEFGISRSGWDSLKRRGLTPDILQPAGPGGRQIITPENRAKWIREHTVPATAAE